MTDPKLHLSPPFRAEHVGSLLRPPALREKYSQLAEGEQVPDGPADAAVEEVVALQREIGIESITDGEMRRIRFTDGVFENLEGMKNIPEYPITNLKEYISYVRVRKAAGATHVPAVFCDGKIKRTKPFLVDQFKFTKNLVAPEEVSKIKVNICPPFLYHQFHGSERTYDSNVYKNDDEYFTDLAVAYRAEFQELYDLGCRHIQLDDATFTNFSDETSLASMKSSGVDPQALLDQYVRAINLCTEGRAEDLVVSIHICRGNWKGRHYTTGGYEPLAEVFRRLDVDAYFLEFDDERSGNFDPLRHVPNDKVVVLGLITTKRAQLESIDALKARVHEAATAMAQGGARSEAEALNQLCISPQCGFASSWEGNPEMTAEVQRQKLKLVVDAAREIWPA